MPLAQVHNTELYYHRVGTGPPCLLMHGGFGMDHRMLHPWLDPLRDTLELIYYDHRCNGRSGRPPLTTFSLEQLADDADGLRRRLGHERVFLLGGSFGGYVALEYALRYPESVRGLILVCTSSAWDFSDEIAALALRRGATSEQLAILSAVEATEADEQMRDGLRKILPLYFSSPRPDAEALLAESMLLSAATCAHGFRMLKGYSRTERLAELTMPCLVIAGRDDFIHPPSQSTRLHNGLANSELRIFERSGHFPYIEEPVLFFSVVRDWLADLC